MTLLSLNGLTVTRGDHTVVSDVSLEVAAGEVVGLIGPNGAGKTTLMRAALGLVPSMGTSSLKEMSAGARAQAAAWMPQEREVAWPISVEELVLLGRLPHGASIGRVSYEDQAAVDVALDALALQPLRSRVATELSGGEKARVLLARAIAQETPLILADEPTAGLDPGHQINAMTAFAALAEAGRAVVVSLHDLGLAVRHSTRLILLDQGQVVADGAPMDVIRSDLLASVFGIRAHVADTPDGPVFQSLDTVE